MLWHAAASKLPSAAVCGHQHACTLTAGSSRPAGGGGDAGGGSAAAVGGRAEPQNAAQARGAPLPVLQLLQRQPARRSTLEVFHVSCGHIFAQSTTTSQT